MVALTSGPAPGKGGVASSADLGSSSIPNLSGLSVPQVDPHANRVARYLSIGQADNGNNPYGSSAHHIAPSSASAVPSGAGPSGSYPAGATPASPPNSPPPTSTKSPSDGSGGAPTTIEQDLSFARRVFEGLRNFGNVFVGFVDGVANRMIPRAWNTFFLGLHDQSWLGGERGLGKRVEAKYWGTVPDEAKSKRDQAQANAASKQKEEERDNEHKTQTTILGDVRDTLKSLLTAFRGGTP